jgi:DNA helicase-2/ATP-dependent DNA helicase PcrA
VFSCSKSEQKQLNTWVSFQSAEQPLLGQFWVSGNSVGPKCKGLETKLDDTLPFLEQILSIQSQNAITLKATPHHLGILIGIAIRDRSKTRANGGKNGGITDLF